ncbi:MAG: TOBE domain-containing protein, partial [Phycisphaerales bacterium]
PDQACALGFRPDRIRLVAAGATGSVAAMVAAVERLGDRTDIALDSAWGRVVARIAADDAVGIREGEACGFEPDAQHLHLFEPGECGARISPR